MSHQSVDILTDGHIHTRLCNHASGEMEEYVLAGIERNLRSIVFLEHMETGISYYKKSWLSDEDFSYYLREGERLKQKYASRINVQLGVELGYNKNSLAETYRRLEMFNWDSVGISCHFLDLDDDCDYHLNLLSRDQINTDRILEHGINRILATYLQSLTEAVMTFPGTVLCHLDAALRNIPGVSLTKDHMDQVDVLLDAVKQRAMALEINTSGFSIRDEPFPAKPLLRKAIARGIPLTVSSDAHSPSEVGRHFDRVESYIKEAAPF